jgi:urease beta subunit
MTANKMYDLEKPDDRARNLASQLSLEEQVGSHFHFFPLVTALLCHTTLASEERASAHTCTSLSFVLVL